MIQNELFELNFQGDPAENDWAVLNLEATFSCGTDTKTVKGFYDGNGNYKIRFLPEKTGLYRYKVSGIFQADGEEYCTPSDAHGIVRAKDTHFEYADGTPYYPFGTTIYAFAHQPENLIEQTLETLKSAPFNKVRMCIFPKHYVWNNNEPELYAFHKNESGWDVNRPCVEFWQRFESLLLKLNKMNIQADLILFHPYDRWGFSKFSEKEDLIYLETVVRRLSAFPNVWWSLANEYDFLVEKTDASWKAYGEFLNKNDCFNHLLSCHNCFFPFDYSLPFVTHCSVQSPDMTLTKEYLEKYRKPFINDECCYEGNIPHNWGNLTPEAMVNHFWCIVCDGGYATHGETYLNDDDVLWWSKGGSLVGKSPARIAFLRKIVESLPYPLTPLQTASQSDTDSSQEENFFSAIINKLDPVAKKIFRLKHEPHFAQSKEEAYLLYFKDTCPAYFDIPLPEENNYKIEVIDAWEMTRKTAFESGSGNLRIPLLSKPYMAILVTKV